MKLVPKTLFNGNRLKKPNQNHSFFCFYFAENWNVNTLTDHVTVLLREYGPVRLEQDQMF